MQENKQYTLPYGKGKHNRESNFFDRDCVFR